MVRAGRKKLGCTVPGDDLREITAFRNQPCGTMAESMTFLRQEIARAR
jgi:hypothetical protein